MAWTAPRTWVTAEVVTAALMNTHVRDNLLQTAPAIVTTAGDFVYATAANTIARLPAGTTGQFLRGATTPSWNNELGDATTSGQLILRGPIPALRWQDQGATDPLDYFQFQGADNSFRMIHHDDSDVDTTVFTMAPKDLILHTGDKGQGEGAVVIATATGASATAVTTTGSVYMSASVATGGPAYVEGLWQVQVKRTSAASTSTFDILPRDDGTNLSPNRFAYSTPNPIGDGDIIPAANDEVAINGTFFVRHTATNTSAYQIFVSAGDNSRFELQGGFLYVRSIQYPT